MAKSLRGKNFPRRKTTERFVLLAATNIGLMRRMGYGETDDSAKEGAAMKSLLLGAAVLMVVAQGVGGSGKASVTDIPNEQLEQIERHLACVLQCGNPYILADVGDLVFELKQARPDQPFSELIIPLMAVVKNADAHPGARVSAARALHALDSRKGDFAIRRVARFADAGVVKQVTTWLTYDRLSQ